jgi:hypothetical protein
MEKDLAQPARRQANLHGRGGASEVSPEIAEARDATLKAMKEAEAGWRKAMDKIAERAGLTKGPNGVTLAPR